MSVQDEAANIQYIRKMAITGRVLSQYLRQQKLEKEEKQGEEPSWKDNPQHSIYHWGKRSDIKNPYHLLKLKKKDCTYDSSRNKCMFVFL